MNLSTKVLNKPKSANYITVLPFVDSQKYTDVEENASEEDNITYVKSGDFTEINAGKLALNFFCKNCDDTRTFMSSNKMHCLIVHNELISIDTFLSCPVCGTLIQVWILLEVKEMFSEEPKVRILKRVDKLNENVTELNNREFGDFTELLEKALRASRDGFGAGAIIYLRKVFEQITVLVAKDTNVKITYIDTKTGEERRRKFSKLFEEVDNKVKIVPQEFSDNGYNLFGKLSDVVHGEYDEEVALEKFSAFYRLITGIIINIKNKSEFSNAIKAIGLDDGGETDE